MGELHLQATCYVYVLRLRSVLLKLPNRSSTSRLQTQFVVRQQVNKGVLLSDDFHKNLRDLLGRILIENIPNWKNCALNNLGKQTFSFHLSCNCCPRCTTTRDRTIRGIIILFHLAHLCCAILQYPCRDWLISIGEWTSKRPQTAWLECLFQHAFSRCR